MALDRKSIWPASVIVFALMIFFPPWLYKDGYTSNQASAGYHFLFAPPGVKTYEEMFGFSTDLPTRFVRVRFNYVRLVVQILTLGSFLPAHHWREKAVVNGSLDAC